MSSVRRQTAWRRRFRAASWILPLFFLLVIALLPYLWVLLTSFKPKDEIFVSPPSLLFDPVLDSYRSVFVDKGFGRYLFNSIVVGLSSTLVAVTIGVLAAYALARHKVPGSNHLMFFILSTRLGPPVAFALPMYLIFYRLDPVPAYWVGMVPLAVDGVVAAILAAITTLTRVS